MNCLFKKCRLLISLPDISKWNTGNVVTMDKLFANCSSLSSLPNISKWNVYKVISLKKLFRGCISLVSLPDISKWNFNDKISIVDIFINCLSLSSLPDIFTLDINDITSSSDIFNNYSPFISFSDNTNLNIEKKNIIREMIIGCISLLNIPDKFKFIFKSFESVNYSNEVTLSIMHSSDYSQENNQLRNTTSFYNESDFEECSISTIRDEEEESNGSDFNNNVFLKLLFNKKK